MKRLFFTLLRTPSFWIFAFLFMPELAHATPADLFSIPSGDISKTMILDKLFPPGDAPGPFGAVAAVLNSALLMAGGLMMTYILSVGTMNTAHDGEALGKKWSTAWVPFRIAGGSAMMMPMGVKGFCAAQVVVIYIITQSIGLADTVWTAYTQQGFAQSVFATSSVPTDDLKVIALEMLKSNDCMASLENSRAHGAPDTMMSMVQDPKIGWTYGNTPDGGYQIEYGISNDPRQIAICGHIVLDKNQQLVQSGAVASDQQLANFQFDSQTQALGQVQDELWQNQKTEMDLMNETMAKTATAYVLHHTQVMPAVNQSITDYQLHIQMAAAKKASDNKLFKEVAKNAAAQGWVGAGQWYIHLANFQQGLAVIVAHLPKIAPVQDKDALKMQSVQYDLENLESDIKNENLAFASAAKQGAMDQGDDGAWYGWVTDFGGHLTKLLVSRVWQGSAPGNWGSAPVNPILAAQSLGNRLTIAGYFVLGIPAAASILLVVPTSVVMVLLTTCVPIAAMLFTGGVMLQWVIPFYPMVLMTMGFIAWVILVIEAFFSASIFAFSHLHPDGNELGKAGHGYGLLFSLFLTPTLMVIGFIAANVIVSLVGPIINELFSSTMDMTRGNYTMGPISILSILGIYIGLMMALIHQSFTEIHRMPSRIMRWAGLEQGAISGITQEGAGHVEKSHTAVVGAVMQTKGGVGRGAQELNNALTQSKAGTRGEKTRSIMQSEEKPEAEIPQPSQPTNE